MKLDTALVAWCPLATSKQRAFRSAFDQFLPLRIVTFTILRDAC